MTMKSTPTFHSTAFTRSDALQRQLQSFAGQLEAGSDLTDGVLTARVVGEFSAGKTRFLRELLGHLIPVPLYPISSLERQTRLQLEITYGKTPTLTLIERTEDYQPAKILKDLASFPERQELGDLDPMTHRLRLALNEHRLILNDGDGFSNDKSPKRLFLIDTPGWNSGDDELAERDASSILTGYHNLALIYVSQAARVDGALNAEHLRGFLDELAGADFLEQPKLIFIVTSCPLAESERCQQRVTDLVRRLWQELGNNPDDLGLDIFCVDFADLSTTELQEFRAAFWNALLAPLQQSAPVEEAWIAALRRWPGEWALTNELTASAKLLERARNLLGKARRDDEFVTGMNQYRLMGLDASQMRQKVKTTWLRQLECNAAELEQWPVPSLPNGHPLLDWWQHYWLDNLNRLLAPVSAFFDRANRTIDSLTPDIEDLKQHLLLALDRPHAQALLNLDSSFANLIDTVQQLLHEPATERRLATLFTLSLLQARYEDHYAIQSQGSAGGGAR